MIKVTVGQMWYAKCVNRGGIVLTEPIPGCTIMLKEDNGQVAMLVDKDGKVFYENSWEYQGSWCEDCKTFCKQTCKIKL